MKISPQRIGALGPLSSQDDSRKGPATGASPRQDSAPRLSRELKMVQQARAQLDALPEVDMEKVAMLRQAIADNALPLDMDALSRAIVDLHGKS
ncbi:flagellar biosynthesis anti-sigma factor FlgM [Zobellella iuensis]|jgi:negative regulator of flagellin synthesis FlgM|uniref:Negative regulator of flagellin synthesis n=1 Tax=Zobellella iuensis TaxID=2803811 RepID=A0ABS1QVH3_9GAMM|nr:flagellar biosynthesis anti-sigma factor FlgM [Zobellella iuensis]MBL1378859.1 flagellar biosynthesis anti-sigma factor FlgM [Zobellella iuensis]